jgi:hypothetical protein
VAIAPQVIAPQAKAKTRFGRIEDISAFPRASALQAADVGAAGSVFPRNGLGYFSKTVEPVFRPDLALLGSYRLFRL